MKTIVNKMENLYIDCQVFQTQAWHRGMGKYSISLLESAQHGLIKRYTTIHLVFNDNLPIQKEVQDVLKSIFPNSIVDTIALKLPDQHGPLHATRIENKKRLSELVKKNSAYLIPALFIDEACIVFPDTTIKHLIFYDLIPFLYHERYKNRINYNNYLDHFATVFEADRLFTISQTVSDDNAMYLGISPSKLVTIDGASIDRSRKAAIKPKLDISKDSYILMPTGDEVRKNNLRAVQGFAQFNNHHNNMYKLVITSRVSDYTRQELEAECGDILFSGNVAEQELQWLLENAHLVLFPPEYEGLGLPILEAMSAHKKVVCSNIPVFREISQSPLYFFNHLDPQSIARSITSAHNDDGFALKKSQYNKILSKYSWENTAQKFLEGLDKFTPLTKATKSKPRAAVVAPDPSGFSAIGKVVAETHDAMSREFDVDYYFDKGTFHKEVRPEFLSHIAPSFDAREFNARIYPDYDVVIYHIGNSDYHLETIKSALHLPGIAILHDTYLQGAYPALERVGYISKERLKAEEILGATKAHMSEYLSSIVRNQKRVIVHSEYAKKATLELTEHDTTNVVNLPVATPVLSNEIKEKFHIGLAGIIADVKGLKIIEELASSPMFSDADISIFGHSFARPEIIEEFSKWINVSVYPDPSDLEFQSKLSSLSVLVNYRLEYRGETSLTTLEAMRHGIPVIVRNIGWYAELPGETVVKVKNTNEVVEAVARLKESGRMRHSIGLAAKNHTKIKHSHENYVNGLLKASKAKTLSKRTSMLSAGLKSHQDLSSIMLDISTI